MSVVNVKVNHIRPEYNNLKEWMDDPSNVYIGRKGIVFVNNERFPKENSKFCNPFKVGKDGTLDEVVEKFEKYIQEKIKSGEIKKEELIELHGKKLGCWCKPNKCHGDVLLKIINSFTS
jgi:hypothetical protein